jgi:hypothetical protein
MTESAPIQVAKHSHDAIESIDLEQDHNKQEQPLVKSNVIEPLDLEKDVSPTLTSPSSTLTSKRGGKLL